jgi:phage gp36-like protein
MAIYCSTSDLEIIMIGTSFDTITTSLADKAITHAENEINKYLAKRYDVSGWVAGSVPPVVSSICEDLAVGYMYLRMGRGSKESFQRAKEISEPALENLKDLRDYKATLFDTSGSVIADNSSGSYYMKSTTENYHQIFDLDDPLNWSIDPDQLDDIEDGRES